MNNKIDAGCLLNWANESFPSRFRHFPHRTQPTGHVYQICSVRWKRPQNNCRTEKFSVWRCQVNNAWHHRKANGKENMSGNGPKEGRRGPPTKRERRKGTKIFIFGHEQVAKMRVGCETGNSTHKMLSSSLLWDELK